MKKILLGAVVATMVVLGFGLVSVVMPAGAQSGGECYTGCTPTQQSLPPGSTTTTVVGTPGTQSTPTTPSPTTPTPTTPAQVESSTATAASSTAAQPAAAANAEESSLAFTGGDIAGIVALALGLVVIGFVVVRSSRRGATD